LFVFEIIDMPKPKPKPESEEDFDDDEEEHGGPRDSDARVCSFCGRDQTEVAKLVAGPAVYICDECIELCSDIMAEESVQPLLKAGFGQPDTELRALLNHSVETLDALVKRCDRDEIKFEQARTMLNVLLSLQDEIAKVKS